MRNKLEALKHAVQELKNGKEYDWTDVESCNCGIIAQSCLEKGKKGLYKELFNPAFYGWSRSCQVTGQKTHQIIIKLIAAGFTKIEIMELEGLSNEEICKEAKLKYDLSYTTPSYGFVNDGYNKKENLIAYLEAWIRIIEREQSPKPEPANPEQPTLPASKPMTYTKKASLEDLVKQNPELVQQN